MTVKKTELTYGGVALHQIVDIYDIEMPVYSLENVTREVRGRNGVAFVRRKDKPKRCKVYFKYEGTDAKSRRDRLAETLLSFQGNYSLLMGGSNTLYRDCRVTGDLECKVVTSKYIKGSFEIDIFYPYRRSAYEKTATISKGELPSTHRFKKRPCTIITINNTGTSTCYPYIRFERNFRTGQIVLEDLATGRAVKMFSGTGQYFTVPERIELNTFTKTVIVNDVLTHPEVDSQFFSCPAKKISKIAVYPTDERDNYQNVRATFFEEWLI